jgi:hypothetical protein
MKCSLDHGESHHYPNPFHPLILHWGFQQSDTASIVSLLSLRCICNPEEDMPLVSLLKQGRPCTIFWETIINIYIFPANRLITILKYT